MTAERRAHPRQVPAGTYAVGVLDQAGRLLFMALPEDVSAGGVRLFSPQPRPAGEVLTLLPSPPHPLAGSPLSFTVTRCQPLPDGGYHLAGTFLRPLGDDEVRALTAP